MSDQWIKIYRASSPIEAELLGGLLRAEGIQVHVPNNPSAGGVGELWGGGGGWGDKERCVKQQEQNPRLHLRAHLRTV